MGSRGGISTSRSVKSKGERRKCEHSSRPFARGSGYRNECPTGWWWPKLAEDKYRGQAEGRVEEEAGGRAWEVMVRKGRTAAEEWQSRRNDFVFVRSIGTADLQVVGRSQRSQCKTHAGSWVQQQGSTARRSLSCSLDCHAAAALCLS